MNQSQKKTQIGIVVSDKMDKTVVVEIARRVKDRHFEKYFVKRSKFKAHDEKNNCKIGDRVQIRECRPVSAHKRWVVTEILEKAV